MTDEARQQIPQCRNQLPPEERTQQLNSAFNATGEGFDQAELDDMTAARIV